MVIRGAIKKPSTLTCQLNRSGQEQDSSFNGHLPTTPAQKIMDPIPHHPPGKNHHWVVWPQAAGYFRMGAEEWLHKPSLCSYPPVLLRKMCVFWLPYSCNWDFRGREQRVFSLNPFGFILFSDMLLDTHTTPTKWNFSFECCCLWSHPV